MPLSLAFAAACLTAGGAQDAGPPHVTAAAWQAQIEADWLLQDAKRLTPPGLAATRESDAAGAVDGVKNGQWGFHTAEEQAPWWQVDLEQTVGLERMVIWNRCEPDMAGRNSRIQVLASEDGKNFKPLYQHDGTVFFGFSDQHPLTVPLPGTRARFLRLALAGTSYFHLDEVEVFAAGSTHNLALGKPATQSSVSQWSVAHLQTGENSPRPHPTAQVIERGLQLAASQRRLGAKNVDQAEQVLREVSRLDAVADVAPNDRRELYFRARRAVRELALANPLLDFDSLLFVKRAPGMFPHMSDQHYGWWSRGGGGICVLEGFKTDTPRVRCLTSDMPEGSFMGPDLSFDGKKLLFAYCRFHPELANEPNKADKTRVPEDVFYHIYEMEVDGSARRQLTQGKYDDFDARYLPNGELVFVSTRKGTTIQCSQWFSDSTRDTDHPDSYVRCGGDNFRPVPVFTLHGMAADGRMLRPLSAFENFEWAPSVANDGRILYTRWDYIDRFNGHFFSLWSANQDGSNPQLVYGNYTVKPQVKIEARAIPGSSKIAFIAAAHHSIYGGSLCLLDRNAGTEGDAPLTRLTPAVPFPETEANVDQFFANPWPLSEDYFLVSWSDRKLPPHCRATEEQNPRNATGIYLLDSFGNLELLHRDPTIASASPLPIAPRGCPPAQPMLAGRDGTQEGRVLLQDVYRGLGGIPRGSVTQLRLVAVPPKVQPHMNQPSLGVSAEDPGKFVLGTVPVEADGSAYFLVPSGVPVFFQALDQRGVAVQTMRTLTYVMPDQTLACIGCHEHRESAPPAGRPALAVAREPSQITPGPAGSWPLRFDQLVQPVLDRRCVECHRPGAKDALAAKLDLTPEHAYDSLLGFADGDLKKHSFERDSSVPGQGTAANSKLWQLLTQADGHAGVVLDADGANRLVTWLDTYAQRAGHFSAQQEAQLAAFRRDCAPLLKAGPPP
ncbi:MAG: discoidin domain-containing protein [Verrucomicrobia bacterium]|nr:discoidin domain-containing protein [Verrucomicrobiota bacterium]